MNWENKVVWAEGLFLQPQHLQQQDRYFERLVRNSTMGLRPFAWGLTELSLDTDMLTLGKFAVRSAAGILPDGTPFNVPEDVDHPHADRPAGIHAQHGGLPAVADPPARRRGDGPAGTAGNGCPLRHRRVRSDRHQCRLSGPAPACRSASCGCATRWRTRRGPASPPSGSRASSKCARTRAPSLMTATSRRC